MENKRKNLAPHLVRQRIVVEATTLKCIDDPALIADFLQKLSLVVGMTAMREPFVYTAHEDGWGAWQHWKTSGAVFYTYPARNGDMPLLTLDCYTCKPFDVQVCVNFVREYWQAVDVVRKEI